MRVHNQSQLSSAFSNRHIILLSTLYADPSYVLISLHHGAGVSRRIQLLIVLLECLCASLTTSYELAKYRKKSHSPAIHRRRCTDQSLQLLKLRPSRTVTDREAIIVTSEIPRDKFLQCGRFTCITLLVHQQLRNRFNKT